MNHSDGALRILLQFMRANESGDPYAFRFEPQDYILPTPGGESPSARFDWTQDMLADLQAVRLPRRDSALVQRVGNRLRAFVRGAGWERHAQDIARALGEHRPVYLTIRSSAAELYALPWELLTLNTDQHIGELDGLLLRFEWPGRTSAAEHPKPRLEGGRILVAWSAASGALPAAEHVQAIAGACAAGFHRFNVDTDVLAHASLGRIAERLEAAQQAGPPVSVLHLLCHGGSEGGTFGLCLDGDSGPVIVDAAQVRAQLAPFASMVRLVVLSACDSGNAGTLGNHLGSVAQALHRCGIQSVIASRFPLSVAGSIELTRNLYNELLTVPASLEVSFMVARKRLLRGEADLPSEQRRLDWASLQLYAGQEDGDDTRPIIFRPYRGLLSFQPEHQRFFYGRDDVVGEIVRELHALITAGRPRLLVVAGASGSGKSSVVLAGAVPRLLREEGATWQLLQMRPGSQPLEGLAAALPWGSAAPQSRAAPLLLLVDQFEEVFTHGAAPSVRQAFAQRLWALVTDPGCNISVILTLRVDFAGQCDELTLDGSGLSLARIVYSEAHRIFVAKLDPSDLRAAAVEPARKLGLHLEEGLVDRMLADLGAEPGALPLLEYVLDLLWQHREGGLLTQSAYDKLGGVMSALHGRAEELIGSLTAQEQRLARRLLVRLVSLGAGAALGTRRRVPLEKLRPSAPADSAAFDRVLALLIDARLLVRDGQGPEHLIEVAHEALIRKWPRLIEWVQADRQMLAELEKLEAWVEEWRDQGALLIGNRLGYVGELAQRYGDDFSSDARSLLAASRAHAAGQQRKRQAWMAVLALLTLAATGFGWLARRSQQQFRQELLATYVEEGRQQLIEQGRPSEALLWLQRANAQGYRAPMLPFLLADAARFLDVIQTTLVGHQRAVLTARFSPDGRRIVTASQDQTARIWDALDGKLLLELKGHDDFLMAASFSPDGKRVVTASMDHMALVFDAESGALLTRLAGHEKTVWDASFSPDGKRLVTFSADMTVRLWDPDGGSKFVIKGLGDQVYTAKFSSDGRRLVTASSDQTARVWDIVSGTLLKELRGHSAAVSYAEFSPNGRRIVTASGDGTARVWDTESGGVLQEFKGHAGPVVTASFHPSGKFLVTAGRDGTARVWDVTSGALLGTLTGHRQGLRGASFSPDGARIVTTGHDQTARVWDVYRGTLLADLGGHTTSVFEASFSPDGRHIVTASRDKTARVWEVESRQLLTEFDGSRGPLTAASFSPDGRRVVAASRDKTAWVFDSASGKLQATLTGHQAPLTAVGFSPDGRRIVTASRDHTARIWDSERASLQAALVGHRQDVTAARFSPDGRRVVTASDDHTGRIWDAQGGQALLELIGHKSPVVAASFSPDSRRIVTASLDETARVWDAQTGKLVAVLRGHGQSVFAADFSPDGRRIVTASDDTTARIWEVETGRELRRLLGHEGQVLSAHYSPDGRRIVTASVDGTVRVFAAESGALLQQLYGHGRRIDSAGFSPDGLRIVAASDDDTVRVWDAEAGGLVAMLKGHRGQVVEASFSPDSRRILTAGTDGTARIWNAAPEARTPAQMDALLRCRLSIRLAGNTIIPVQPEADKCAGLPVLPPPPVRWQARMRSLAAGLYAWKRGGSAAAQRLFAEARADLAATGDEAGLAQLSFVEAVAAGAAAEPIGDSTPRFAEIAMAVERSAPDPEVAAKTLADMAHWALDYLDAPNAAIWAYREALRLRPTEPWVQVKLLSALLSVGQFEEVLNRAETSFKAQPEGDSARVVLACLVWVAAQAAGDKSAEATWAERTQRGYETIHNGSLVDWTFDGMQHAWLKLLPRPSGFDGLLACIDLLQRPKTGESAAELNRVLHHQPSHK